MRSILRSAAFCAAIPLFLSAFAWSQLLYATGENTEQLDEVNMSTGVVTVLSHLTSKPDSVIVDAQGRLLYTTTNPGTVSLFDPVSGLTSVVASGLRYPRDLVWDPGQSSFLVANFGIGAIDRVNLVTGTVTPLLTKQGTVDGLAYDPTGQLFAVVNHHTQVVQVDPNSGTVLQRLTVVTNQTIGWYGLDGLTYDPYTGQLWATDVGTGANCLVEIPTDLSTFTLFQVGKMLIPDGVVSDGLGNLYVAVDGKKVYQYSIPTDTITKMVAVKSVDDLALVP